MSVARVVQVARRIADPHDALGREARDRLHETSGLSAEGVELALTEYLETNPSQEEIAALTANATHAPRCHVVLSANVCTAPVRAIACALACAPEVKVKPSRRDPVIAELVARELALDIVEAIEPQPGDEVHVYGADKTIAAFRQSLGSGVTLRGHGTGVGIAVLDDLASAGAVAADLVVFDGQGCLSPRFVLVSSRLDDMAAALHEALLRSTTPRGPLTAEARAELARTKRTWEAIGPWLEGPHHALALDPAPEALALLPAYRTALVTLGDDELIEPWRPYITAVGGEGPLADRIAALCPAARRSPLGRMQKPPFDGPVDRRSSTLKLC